MLSQKTVQKWVKIFNDRYWAGALPEVEIEMKQDIRMATKDRRRLWGATLRDPEGEFTIEMDMNHPSRWWKLTLAHELSHVEVWPANHGSKEWKAAVQRLSEKGFLQEIF